MKKNFFSFLLLFIPFVYTGQIVGYVNVEYNIPVEFATVSLYKNSDSSLVSGNITDQNGAFKIDIPSPGNYFLVCSFVGYESKTIPNISISKKSATIDLSFILLNQGKQLKEVLIRFQIIQ